MGLNIFEAAKAIAAQRAANETAHLSSKQEATQAASSVDLTPIAPVAVASNRATVFAPAPKTTPALPVAPAIQLNAMQLKAVGTFRHNSHGALIGYAGTGKTTTLKEAVRQIVEHEPLLEHGCKHLAAISLPTEAPPFIMCAFTGMAVKAMRRAVGVNSEFAKHCFTIHKLLDYGPVEEMLPPSKNDLKNGWAYGVPKLKRVFKPRRDGLNKLPFKIIVIDEVSMLRVALFNQLVEALPDDCRIYIIGDIAQLPPVCGSSVMPPLVQHWPSIELTEIYRQKDGSMIDNANRIRAGQAPVQSDLFRIGGLDTDASIAQGTVINTVAADFASGRYDPVKDIILCTNNVGPVGQELLNVFLREKLNIGTSPIVNVGTMRGVKRYKLGDRVMTTKNDADLGTYNGMLGWVTDIRVSRNMHKEAWALNSYTTEADTINSAAQADLLSTVITEIEQEQEAVKAARKLDNFMTSGGATIIDDSDDDNEGTASRQATHQVTVMFDDLDTPVIFYTSGQLENLILAWAITVHKSQGSGFRNVYLVLHNTGGQLLVNELLYTAITRCEQAVTVMTTKYAWGKALTTQRIKGRTLAEKMQSFVENYGGRDDTALRDMRVPFNRTLETIEHA